MADGSLKPYDAQIPGLGVLQAKTFAVPIPAPVAPKEPVVTISKTAPVHPPMSPATSPQPIPPVVSTPSAPTLPTSSFLDQELGKLRQDLLQKIAPPSVPVATPSIQPLLSTLPRPIITPAPSLVAPRELLWSQLGVGYVGMPPFTRPMMNGGLSGAMTGLRPSAAQDPRSLTTRVASLEAHAGIVEVLEYLSTLQLGASPASAGVLQEVAARLTEALGALHVGRWSSALSSIDLALVALKRATAVSAIPPATRFALMTAIANGLIPPIVLLGEGEAGGLGTDPCGEYLGQVEFRPIIRGATVVMTIRIYENCLRVSTKMPDGTPLLDPPTEVPNNTPAPPPGGPAGGHLQITTGGHTVNTRIYDLARNDWPIQIVGGVLVSAPGYLKFIEVDGDCDWKFVQLGRVTITVKDNNGVEVIHDSYPKSGVGVDWTGAPPFAGKADNPEYDGAHGPVTKDATKPHTDCLLDFPQFKGGMQGKEGLKLLYEDSNVRSVQLDWEFHTWIICDGVPLGFWKWFFVETFDVQADGSKANERINPFGSTDPAFGPANAANTSELSGLTLPR